MSSFNIVETEGLYLLIEILPDSFYQEDTGKVCPTIGLGIEIVK